MKDENSIILEINPIKLMLEVKELLDDKRKENLLIQMVDYIEINYDVHFISLGKISINKENATLFMLKFSDCITTLE